MQATAIQRPWCLEMGEGQSLILILPRMDTAVISTVEWEATLRPFWKESRFLILDMPEKLVQEHGGPVEFTVQELAVEVQRYLQATNLQPDLIWGFSLGGMIAQEVSVLAGMEAIPLLLVSTNAYADMTLQAVFSSWSLMVHSFGEAAFQQSLIPWIAKAGELPILTTAIEQKGNAADDPLGIAKATSSLRAVSLHDARPRLSQIQAPVMVLFGEHSILLHEAHAQVFRELIPHAQVEFIDHAGMRIMGDNSERVLSCIKSFFGANVK